MSYVRIWIHAVWGTKRRSPFLNNSIRGDILRHILYNAQKKDIHIDIINGWHDHLHCLVSLKGEQSISQVMQLIKGESSFWINKEHLIRGKFEWADEYFAVSIGISSVRKVRDYIRNQEKHHRKKTWDEEYNEYIQQYGFEIFQSKEPQAEEPQAEA